MKKYASGNEPNNIDPSQKKGRTMGESRLVVG